MPLDPLLYVRARKANQEGDFRQAEAICRGILKENLENAPAWHLLGESLQNQSRFIEAEEALQQALQRRPGDPQVLFALGNALAAEGRRAEANNLFQQILAARPDSPELLTNIAISLAQDGRVDEAVDLFRKAIQIGPEFVKAHHNLGVALAQLGRAEEARQSLEIALALKPDYAEAWYNLGTVLGGQGKRDEAIVAFRKAIEHRPAYAEACNNLGLALTDAGRPEEAAVILRQAVRLNPMLAEAHNNLGLALSALGRFTEAEVCYNEGLRLEPTNALAHGNLASCWKAQGRLEEALAGYDYALALDPGSASIRYNRSLALLQAGDFQRGWPEYEWRWQRRRERPRLFRQPRWDGSSLAGRTILLWCEQGLGDSIQFVRYAPLLKRQAHKVYVECPGLLHSLFVTCSGIDQVIAEGNSLPDADVQAPLMSLPALLGTTLATVPADVPYLQADDQLVRKWHQRLEGIDGFKVGIAWQGNPHFEMDRFRSVPLSQFADLARIDGIRLISLQKVFGTEQLRALRGRFEVTDFENGSDSLADFQDTAALMTCLDLVVTVDTAAGHLAGALGVPVRLALSAVSDWRWLLDRRDTPWYPTMRIFRQTSLGNWADVFAKIAEALQVDVGHAE